MTEAEWLACAEDADLLGHLLGFVRDRMSDRKRGLFAVACCRQVWHLLTDERSRQAVEVAERFVDGAATDYDLEAAGWEAEAADVALALRCSWSVSVAELVRVQPHLLNSHEFSYTQAAMERWSVPWVLSLCLLGVRGPDQDRGV